MRRLFTAAQKVMLLVRANYKCQQCGCSITWDTFHADHKKPFSRGGRTTLGNGQALCIPCNLRKSNKMNLESFLPSGWKFRNWQTEFLTRFLDVVENQISQPDDKRKAFILDAFPGSGKTLAQLVAMKYLMEKDLIDFIVVTVPSTKLKADFARLAIEMMGLDLYAGKQAHRCSPQVNDGIVLTYAQLAASNTRHLVSDWCKNNRVFVSADEMHHLSEGKSWGGAFAEALEFSKVRLMTSGTPFRTDRSAIPWAEYKNDILQIKPPWGYRFGYKEALEAGDVRNVIFHPWDGVVSWITEIDDDVVELEHKLTDNLDELYGDVYSPHTVLSM
jgi:superfamily II DNA or RNA helicase